MRFLADKSCDFAVVRALRAAGHDVVAVKDVAPGATDEAVVAGYIDRNRPPALKESGAWPLSSLRQSFLNGSLTRLLDTHTTLVKKIGQCGVRAELLRSNC